MSGTETSRTAGVPGWTLVIALLVGLGGGVGLAAWRFQGKASDSALVVGERARQAEEDFAAAQLEGREARMAFRTLAEEHASLQDEADALRARLAATDPGFVGSERPSEVMLAALSRARVVDVSEDLGYIVFDAGSRDGIRPGMVLNVVRDDQVVARVRASDVKDKLTGASVEETEAGSFPQAGDRMVLGTDRGA